MSNDDNSNGETGSNNRMVVENSALREAENEVISIITKVSS
jgi:hypothetical protein